MLILEGRAQIRVAVRSLRLTGGDGCSVICELACHQGNVTCNFRRYSGVAILEQNGGSARSMLV